MHRTSSRRRGLRRLSASRVNGRRAATVGFTSLLTLTLIPLLADAEPGERMMLLLIAVPVAAVFGFLAGYTGATTTRRVMSRRPRGGGGPTARPSRSVITPITACSGDRTLERCEPLSLGQLPPSRRADVHTRRRLHPQRSGLSLVPSLTGEDPAAVIHQDDDGTHEAPHLTLLNTDDGSERRSR